MTELGGFSRVTLVGERRRVDAVLPSDEPIGRLLPDVLRLVDDAVEAPPRLRQLVTAEGDVLPGDGTLAGLGVPDGGLLRLVRADDVPPAPIVHDVTEEVSDDLDTRGWRWDARARRWTATLASVVVTFVAAAALGQAVTADPRAVVLVIVATVLGGVGGAVAAFGKDDVGTALTLGGAGVGLLAAWSVADVNGWPAVARWAAVAVVAAVFLALLGLTSRLGRAGLVGAGFVGVLVGAWGLVAALVGAGSLASGGPRLGAVLAVVSAVLLGLIPRFALSASGLTALDDRRVGGQVVSRTAVETALAAAHRALVIATVATAVSAALAGHLLLVQPNRWTVPLAVVLVLVLASRARAYPLVPEVVALFGAALFVVLRLFAVWLAATPDVPYGPIAAISAVALLPLLVIAVDPAEHVRARLRRITDRIEMLAVLTLFPLAIGVFGTFGRLLDAF